MYSNQPTESVYSGYNSKIAVVQRRKRRQNASVLEDNRTNKPQFPLAQRKSVADVIQCAKIQYDTQAFDIGGGEVELVGKTMTAEIGPQDKLKGSAPGDGVQALLMNTLKSAGYKRMIRGHLLNGQLGGLGIAANLFPITAQANSKHKNHVENHVKKLVTHDQKEVRYTVNVKTNSKQPSINNPNASFECSAIPKDGSSGVTETIHSDPKTTQNSDPKNEEGWISHNTDSLSFPSKYLPDGWGEIGKGYDQGKHSKSYKASDFSYCGKTKVLDSNLYAQGRHFGSGEIDLETYAHELATTLEYDVTLLGMSFSSAGNVSNYIDSLNGDANKIKLLTDSMLAAKSDAG